MSILLGSYSFADLLPLIQFVVIIASLAGVNFNLFLLAVFGYFLLRYELYWLATSLNPEFDSFAYNALSLIHHNYAALLFIGLVVIGCLIFSLYYDRVKRLDNALHAIGFWLKLPIFALLVWNFLEHYTICIFEGDCGICYPVSSFHKYSLFLAVLTLTTLTHFIKTSHRLKVNLSDEMPRQSSAKISTWQNLLFLVIMALLLLQQMWASYILLLTLTAVLFCYRKTLPTICSYFIFILHAFIVPVLSLRKK